MTYRLSLWFDMLEEEGRSTENIRRLFANRVPPLSKDRSSSNRRRRDGDGYGSGLGTGFGTGSGHGNGYLADSHNGDGYGGGLIDLYPEILVIKI